MVGTPTIIADQMEEWLMTKACDGFNACPPICRAGSTTSSTGWCRNCSAGGCSARNTREDTTRESWLALAHPTKFFTPTPLGLALE